MSWRRLSAGAVPIVVAAAVAALAASPLKGRLDAPVFDWLSTIAPPPPSSDVVIVAIDEPSFAEIGRQWPWPRSLHAELVEALRAAGARAIALDIVFAEPSTPEADAALAAAMGPDVVLGADETVVETPHATQAIRVEPIPELLVKGASAGVVSVVLDRDGILRRLPPYEGGFAETLARKSAPGLVPPPEGALAPFRGGPRTYATVSYYQALKPQEFLPPGALRGKTVFVGLSTQTAADASASGADAFATPFTARSGRLTAGVEAQATMFDAIRSGRAIAPAPLWAEFLALGVAALAGAGLARGGRASWKAVAGAAALSLTAAGASWAALRHGDLWLSPVAPALALLLVVAVDAAIDYARERKARREISRAFGQYLAPELVDRLARDPASLKLGGEKRTLTVLFCDVRGFTTLAEVMKDDPERLTSLVNRLLGPLSDAVLAEGGTIDKYIGDCVMAFWNAPLEAHDHATRAVAAGLRMLEAVDALNRELLAEAAPGVAPLAFSVGVGINTGDCVVGNLGSDKRFDYTAIGDAVNLASRLESASRLYAVPLLIGAETAARAGGDFAMIELDRVAVKGRVGGLGVFTTFGSGGISGTATAVKAAQSGFLDAFRGTDWEGAERALGRLREIEPRLYLYADRMADRVRLLRADPPPSDWDGVFTAREK